MRKSYRGSRIGEEIKKIISELLRRDLKDPRFDRIMSISGVEASVDGSFATVYITMVTGGEDAEVLEREKSDVLAAFERAKGKIRGEIGAKLKLRRAPELRFMFDTTEEYAEKMEKIMNELGLGSAKKSTNNTLPAVAGVLKEAKLIHLFPHERPDGDTIGASVGLCLILREMDKEAHVILDEKLPDNLAFIGNGVIIGPENLPKADVSVLLDVSERTRIGNRRDAFENADITVGIDHHVTAEFTCDYNLVDPEAAAAAELVFDIAEFWDVITPEAAEALYVGILTDTGRFQYSMTTARTHEIAATLIENGANPNKAFIEIYESDRLEKIQLSVEVCKTVKSVKEGKGLIAILSRDMLEKTGAMDEESEGIPEYLRGIRGVEVAVVLKEQSDGSVKAALRSKSYFNVAELASKYGGGGHVRSAGFKTNLSLEEIRQEISDDLESNL
jgi:phosphoesterase RecJ-like protein